MKRRRDKQKGIFTAVMAVLLVLAVSVCIGQVVGKYYLKNISGYGAGQTVEKKKALKLKRFDYYYIQVASCTKQNTAVQLADLLAKQELPVVVIGKQPFRVLLGFVNKSDKLQPLADSIIIDGQKTTVYQGQINDESFKFAPQDLYAAQVVAPFLGQISDCLEKSLSLFTKTDLNAGHLPEIKEEYHVLASTVENIASQGQSIDKGQTPDSYDKISSLTKRCQEWAQDLRAMGDESAAYEFLVCQQQALALLEDYRALISGSK